MLEGNLCSFWFDMTFTGASAGMSALTIALPFAAVGHANFAVIGNGIFIVPYARPSGSSGLALGGAGAGQSVIRYQTEDGLYGVDHRPRHRRRRRRPRHRPLPRRLTLRRNQP